MTRLLGVDPGLRFTGWGVIEADGNRLRHIADGVIATDSATSVPERLKVLHDALMALLARFRPDEAAIEETYVNRNGAATLKLGYARGVALLTPALAGVPVTEYAAKSVKLSVVGTGGAEKAQVQMMVRRLLPGAAIGRSDAADALAVAICHAHHRASRIAWAAAANTVADSDPAGIAASTRWFGVLRPPSLGQQRGPVIRRISLVKLASKHRIGIGPRAGLAQRVLVVHPGVHDDSAGTVEAEEQAEPAEGISPAASADAKDPVCCPARIRARSDRAGSRVRGISS